MMVVGVTTGDTFTPGAAETLFELPPGFSSANPGRVYDLSPDGTRFLSMMAITDEAPATPAGTDFKVILNWFDELQRLVPSP